MFSFFTKKKKKKNPAPDYDSKLIKKFHKDHEKLVKQVTLVKEAVENNEPQKAKQGLKKLKMEMLAHFMEEDIKLYWYLKHHYKESSDTIETIKMFEESIKRIQKEVVAFIDHYSRDEIKFDMVFDKDFQGIIDALSSRMETEESSLYTLYKK